jgi:hypothetical protein
MSEAMLADVEDGSPAGTDPEGSLGSGYRHR